MCMDVYGRGNYLLKPLLVFARRVATWHFVEHELEHSSWHTLCLNGMNDDENHKV